ncbi:hypothetical protein JD508_18805 [Aeromonas jandaei]|uniref:hypothetical protein n=1 Tax=Aeromonas jandaei TaxID=650 RepID=UPI00191C980A|nr:hypothetical protein [Aeromonas jandaei]MBL0612279.1 hypothetical protein [Aeromonas jandaei]
MNSLPLPLPLPLPLVNVFNTPYELWTKRRATFEEIQESGNIHLMIKEKRIVRICNHIDAAKYILSKQHDESFENFIETQLIQSTDFNNMRGAMPPQTPKSLSDYQRRYRPHTFLLVSSDINNVGKTLSEGQILFHGGFWPNPSIGSEIITSRPFSTSFSPQMALRNANWNGKAYDAGEINLFVLRVVSPKTKAFIFRIKGTEKGHEKEVLFSSGAKLTLKRKELIDATTVAYKVDPNNNINLLSKPAPSYILEVDIS